MSSSTLPKLRAFRLTTLAVSIAAAMSFSHAQAAGLGELSVQSALGQPLRAEVELINAKEEEGALNVRLASLDAYRQANIEFNAVLSSLRFTVERRGDRQIVRITSAVPMNEPYIDLLLELGSSSGRVVREYVFLLDPDSLYPAQAAAAVSVAEAAPVAKKPVPRNAAPAAAAKTAETPAGKTSAAQATVSGKPRLTLSSPRAVSGIAMEEYAAMEKAVSDADARVKTLEQKVGDLQKLLEVTNSLLEELRKHNELARTNMAAAPASNASASASATSTTATATPSPAAPDATPNAASAPAAVTGIKSAASMPPAATAPATAKPKPAAPQSDSGFDDELLLPGAGLLLVLLGAGGLYVARRRKAHQSQAAERYAGAGGVPVVTIPAASAAQDSVATTTLGASLVLPDTEAGSSGEVDVVSEADVYIAFGRDVQAEQVLKEALRVQPQRHAARVKLLTIYATRKDAQAFEAMASELYAMTGGKGAEWRQAATMGREIDPGNPLYAAASPAEPVSIELMEEAAEVAEVAEVPEASLAAQATPLAMLTPVEESASPEPVSNVLDFPVSETKAALPELLPPAPEGRKEPPQAEAGPIDFDVLLPEVPFVREVPKEEPTPLEFDFQLPELPVAAAEAAPAALTETTNTGPGLLDLDFLMPETPAAEKPPRTA
jgi:pilus assembly protein FimV